MKLVNQIIVVSVFGLCVVSCNSRKAESIRKWTGNGINIERNLIDTSKNLYYDFMIDKTFFTDSLFNQLYSAPEYSSIKTADTVYYVYKRDEFFKNKKYRSLKVSIGDPNKTHSPRTYYIMENFGLITIFGKGYIIELDTIIMNNHTYDRNFLEGKKPSS